MLPLGLMALIMFAALFFPPGLVKEKITVAITGALSGAVLLSSVNAGLGSIGYVIAVEYIFYLFFGLCLLCILSVLLSEQFRVSGDTGAAAVVEKLIRILFATTTVAVIAAAWLAAAVW